MFDAASFRDEELVPIIRDENPQLYRVLMERYVTKLQRYAMVFVKDHDQAEDIVQSAFIKAFENLNGFNTKQRFSSWIYRIVHNEALNLIRKQKRIVPIDDVPEGVLSKDDAKSMGESIDAEARRKDLRKQIVSLPLKYREPLQLALIEERSYEEISDILHMPIGTVGTRITRAKTMLKQRFESLHP